MSYHQSLNQLRKRRFRSFLRAYSATVSLGAVLSGVLCEVWHRTHRFYLFTFYVFYVLCRLHRLHRLRLLLFYTALNGQTRQCGVSGVSVTPCYTVYTALTPLLLFYVNQLEVPCIPGSTRNKINGAETV